MYLLYLNISNEDFDKYVGSTYITHYVGFDRRHGNMCRFLYAWTDSKKLMKEFFTVRDINKFDVVKASDIDMEEYQETHPSLKLKRVDLHTGITPQRKKDDLVSLVLTEYEENNCTSDIQEAFYENISESFKGGVSDYAIFKDKYIKALSQLGYCQLYDIYLADDDSRNLHASELESYNLQSDIFGLNSNMSLNSQMCSEVSAFIMQYNFTC